MKLHRISPAATQAEHDRFLVLDAPLLTAKAAHAAENPRRREIHRLHRDDSSSLHRMLNAVQSGTYVRPHRHLHPPKAESFVLLTGRCGFAVFDDDGILPDSGLILLDAAQGSVALDIRPGAWHALVCMAPNTVLFEAKPGPYAPHQDKDFAPWAPQEGTAEAYGWVRQMEERLAARFGVPLPPAPTHLTPTFLSTLP